jgi:hypothetical protein
MMVDIDEIVFADVLKGDLFMREQISKQEESNHGGCGFL